MWMTEGFHRPTCLEPQGLVPGRQSPPGTSPVSKRSSVAWGHVSSGAQRGGQPPLEGRAATGGQVCWRRPDGGSEPSRDWILATMSVALQQPMSPESAEARSETFPRARPRVRKQDPHPCLESPKMHFRHGSRGWTERPIWTARRPTPWSWPAMASVTPRVGRRRSGWPSTARPGHWGGWETAAGSTRRSSAPMRESLGCRLVRA